jgi:hypothetical protein
MKTIISEDSVILLNNVPREMYEKEKDTYNTEEINKKLFEVFRESEILKEYNYFYDEVNGALNYIN